MANLNFNGIIRGGVIRNMQILGFGADPTPTPPGPTPLQVSTSVRLNPADTPNISFIPTLTGNAQTLTFSAWIKRSLLSSQQMLFGANTDTNNHVFLEFQANDTIRIASNTATSTVIQLITTQVFRDPSQWYHLVLTFDLTNSTQADRVRLYINGARVTAFSTSTLPANTTTFTTFNTSGVQQYIGRYVASSSFYFGGYIADINLVDGQALTPAAFTETDSATGQLIPMTYSGSYGVNGFYLPFGNSATVAELGLDPKTTGQDYPYWPYTTLLVNSSSTNGAQNNTFLDSSTNAFSITRNGNPTQGNFTPFNYSGGTEQTAGYYSAYFDGTGDYLTATSGSAFAFGTGDFTCELWYYLNSGTNNGLFQIASSAFPGVSGLAVAVYLNKINVYYGASSQLYPFGYVSTGSWNHVALVRQSGSLYVYINGIKYTVAASDTTNYAGTTVGIGGYYSTSQLWNGYISNFRVVKGTAVYTANFAVPTTPLTAIANTSLLTCQSSQFIDNSTNALSITAVADARPVPTNPFNMTDWSGYFDGAGDYLTFPATTTQIIGQSAITTTSTFTIEAWVFITAAAPGPTNGIVIGNMTPTSNTNNWSFGLNSSNLITFFWYDGASKYCTGSSIVLNTWAHIAVSISSGAIKMFINGVLQTLSGNTTLTNGTANINSYSIGAYNSGYFSGNISNLRVVKSALYSESFTPSTAPLTAIANTSLLTCQNSTFVDNSTNGFIITPSGDAYTGTLNNPFGNPINYTTPPVQAWSTYFDGASQLQVSTTNAAFDIAGDFTVEGWFNVSGGYQFFGIEQAASPEYAAIQLQLDGSSRLLMLFSTSGSSWALQVTATPTYAFNQWNHLAITRSGSTIRLFQNGSVMASGTLSGALYSSGVRTCINGRNASGYITGSYSNFRFINGQALYTSNFTPSTEPLTLTSQGAQASAVKLLTCQSNRFIDNSLFNWPLTVGGTPQTQASSPFTPTTAYSAASYGGSMYFDGSDYLTAPHNASLSPTGNFTIEFWAYNMGSAVTITEWVTKGYGIQVYSYNSLWYAALSSNNTSTYFINSSFGAARTKTWQHIAITRNGNTYTGFVNGVATSLGTSASAPGTGTDLFSVGVNTVSTPYFVTGYVSGLRVINGTALYTTPFVPPVAPPTAIANTSLLLNATNAGIYDAAGQNLLETVGTAQVTTAVKKFGESSISFDGSGDYVVQPTSSSYGYGTGNFTIEFWLYLNTTSTQTIFSNLTSASSTNPHIYINTTIRYYTANADRITGASLSAGQWYHIAVCRVSGSTRLFINGTQSGSTYADANNYGTTAPLGIGTYWASGSPHPTQTLSGYLQDLRITRGVGRYSGNFTPPAAAFAYNQYDICNQQWTPANISVTAGVGQDNLADSPSDYGTDTGLGGQVRGNYCTLNPLDSGTTGMLSNGGLDYNLGGATSYVSRATFAMSSGKWYCEWTFTAGTNSDVGICTAQAALNQYLGQNAYGWIYYNSGQKFTNATGTAYGASYTFGDVIGIAFDADVGSLTFYKNGVSQGVAFSGLTSGPYFFAVGSYSTTGSFNFGQRAFAYAAPTGFKCLVSTNLPTPTIGATSTTQADNYFEAVTYTGNGTTQSVLLPGAGFTPDFTWIKSRSVATEWHVLCDSLRGPNKLIYSNSDLGEATVTNVLNSFDSGGFSVGYNAAYTSARVNTNAATYVGWAWRGGGSTGVTNNDGSITSTISASTTSGFSVVRYTGTGANGTIGHGLGKQLKYIMVKEMSNTDSWLVWHIALSGTQYLVLNSAAAAATLATVWNSTVPSSSAPYVFSVGTNTAINQSGQQYVAYCFTDISSFSSMGSYTGNGSSTQGPMIYTGFRPEFVYIKATANAFGGVMYDAARNPRNLTTQLLIPSNADAEITGVGDSLDFLSNGFITRNAGQELNQSSVPYLYLAIAEFPFKYARAR